MKGMDKARKALIDVMRFLNAHVEKTSGEVMHIEQLRDAIAALESEKYAFDSEQKQGSYDNPIAELEKPAVIKDCLIGDVAEDAKTLVFDIFRWTTQAPLEESMPKCLALIDQFAKTYHAKECARCKAVIEDDVSVREA